MREWIEAGTLIVLATAGVTLGTFTFFGTYWYRLWTTDKDDNA